MRANPVHTRPILSYPAPMNTEAKRKRGPLLRAVILLQLKLALSAARDLVLIPLALVAAVFDFLRMKTHEPQYFRSVLKIGERSDRFIDVWYDVHPHDAQAAPRENVDALLTRVEGLVRDREQGARQARVLKRWAERQMQRAGKRAAQEVSTRMKAIADKSGKKD